MFECYGRNGIMGSSKFGNIGRLSAQALVRHRVLFCWQQFGGTRSVYITEWTIHEPVHRQKLPRNTHDLSLIRVLQIEGSSRKEENSSSNDLGAKKFGSATTKL
jgi:hypothetical protein